MQIHFQFSEPLQVHLAYKFTKSANMTPKVFFPNIFNMGIKNAEFTKLFKNTIFCTGVCTLKCTENRFIPFTPLNFLPYRI
jgi:epoxyqueuosine reductase QueG